MPAPRTRTARRLAGVVTAALAAGCALPAGALACEGADALPGATDPATLAATTICLVNEERAREGLRPLAAQAELANAAAAHSADMVARAFFAHESPDGGTLLDRLRTARWVPSTGDWTAGENIAWGTGSLASPARIVAAWMESPGHRANILRPAFDEIGMAVAVGAPGRQASVAGTYTADLGVRDDARARPVKRAGAKRRAARAKARAKARQARRASARG